MTQYSPEDQELAAKWMSLRLQRSQMLGVRKGASFCYFATMVCLTVGVFGGTPPWLGFIPPGVVYLYASWQLWKLDKSIDVVVAAGVAASATAKKPRQQATMVN
jgi:hypothetical protein